MNQSLSMCQGPTKLARSAKCSIALTGASINVKVMDAVSFSGRYGAYVWVDSQEVENAANALGA